VIIGYTAREVAVRIQGVGALEMPGLQNVLHWKDYLSSMEELPQSSMEGIPQSSMGSSAYEVAI